jgi:hypothetical protein
LVPSDKGAAKPDCGSMTPTGRQKEEDMDASLFDRLAQTVSQLSRRGALRTALAGATVAAAGFLASAPTNEAKKKKKRKKCPSCPTSPVCPTCTGKALGQLCFNTKECCGTETNRSCARVTGAIGTAPVCCGTGDSPCSKSGDCCVPFDCSAGQCKLVP